MIKYQSFNPHPEFCIYTKRLIVNLILINSNFNFNYTWQFEYGCPFNFVLIPFYCLSTSNIFCFEKEKKKITTVLYIENSSFFYGTFKRHKMDISYKPYFVCQFFPSFLCSFRNLCRIYRRNHTITKLGVIYFIGKPFSSLSFSPLLFQSHINLLIFDTLIHCVFFANILFRYFVANQITRNT